MTPAPSSSNGANANPVFFIETDFFWWRSVGSGTIGCSKSRKGSAVSDDLGQDGAHETLRFCERQRDEGGAEYRLLTRANDARCRCGLLLKYRCDHLR